MEDWKQRMFKERDELRERLANLVDFIENPAFEHQPDFVKHVLHEQHHAMVEYLQALCMRIGYHVTYNGLTGDYIDRN